MARLHSDGEISFGRKCDFFVCVHSVYALTAVALFILHSSKRGYKTIRYHTLRSHIYISIKNSSEICWLQTMSVLVFRLPFFFRFIFIILLSSTSSSTCFLSRLFSLPFYESCYTNYAHFVTSFTMNFIHSYSITFVSGHRVYTLCTELYFETSQYKCYHRRKKNTGEKIMEGKKRDRKRKTSHAEFVAALFIVAIYWAGGLKYLIIMNFNEWHQIRITEKKTTQKEGHER